jgi:hypothetical protein
MPYLSRMRVRVHLVHCRECASAVEDIERQWNSYFSQNQDITPSLIRVLGRLKQDETLILKGWKLDRPPRVSMTHPLLNGGWLFRGAVATGLAGMTFLFVSNSIRSNSVPPLVSTPQSAQLPLAQIRQTEKNGVRVHYVQPELLQSVEFETTSRTR